MAQIKIKDVENAFPLSFRDVVDEIDPGTIVENEAGDLGLVISVSYGDILVGFGIGEEFKDDGLKWRFFTGEVTLSNN